MENAVLCLIMILLFVFGYFVIDRLGSSMSRIYRHAESQTARRKDIRIFFTGENKPDEIEAEIEHIRVMNGGNGAIVFISEDSDLYDRLADRIGSYDAID